MSLKAKFWVGFRRQETKDAAGALTGHTLVVTQAYRVRPDSPTESGGIVVAFEVEIPNSVFEPLITQAVKAIVSDNQVAAKLTLEAIEKDLS